MSVLAKIITLFVWALVTGAISGFIGKAMGNPGDSGAIWLAFLLTGAVVLLAVKRRSANTA